MAERAYTRLVAKHPWLAPHREAFVWGALAADMQEAPGAVHLSRARTHGDTILDSLWREAEATGASSRAFALGWAVHVLADQPREGWLAEGNRAAAIRAAVGAPDTVSTDAMVDLAVDEALIPKSGTVLIEMAKSAWNHAGTPAGAPILGLVGRVLAVDEPSYMAMAGLTTAMTSRGSDRYVQARARFTRVERWLETLRSARVREAVGDLTPVLTEATEEAVQAIEQRYLAEKPPTPASSPATPRPTPTPKRMKGK